MLRRMIAWVTVVAVMMTWGILGDTMSICGQVFDQLTVSAMAEGEDFVIEDGVLKKYNGSATSVVVPDGVTAIGQNAFMNNQTITSVVIPEGVTRIIDGGFNGCTALTSVILPDSLTHIYTMAFYNCRSLTDLYLPDDMIMLSSGAVSSDSIRVHCSIDSNTVKLIAENGQNFYVGEDIDFWVRYYDNELRLVKYKGTEQEVVVPGYVMAIGQDAFRDNKTIESVVIPEGVTRIIDGGFNGCTALTSVTLPDSLTHIYTMAFYNCSSLSDLYLPDNMIMLSSGAVSSDSIRVHCSIDSNTVKLIAENSQNFYVGEDTSFRVRYYDDELRLVKYMGDEQEVVVPGYVTAIGQNAFMNNQTITSVVIPEGVTRIIDGGFNGCTALTSVILPDSLTHIYTMAFYNCRSLTDLYLPDGLTYCGDYSIKSESLRVHCGATSDTAKLISGMGICFYVGEDTDFRVRYYDDELRLVKYMGAGQEAVVPGYVMAIGQDAFMNNQTITSVVIPEGVTRIIDGGFNGCTSLTSVTLPDSLTGIYAMAFNKCSSLPDLYLPDGLTYFDDGSLKSESLRVHCGATSDTAKLISGMSVDFYVEKDTSFRVRYYDDELRLVKYMGDEQEVVVPDYVMAIGQDAFMNNQTITSVMIPEGVTRIIDGGFNGCTALTSITLPDSLTHIYTMAFYNCRSLGDLYLPDDMIMLSSGAVSSDSIRVHCSIDSNTVNLIAENGQNFYVGEDTSFRVRYYDDELRLVKYKGTEQEVVVPGYVMAIGQDAFMNNQTITSVVIPEGVTRIIDGGFNGCTSLTSVTLPDSLTGIYAMAFNNCSSLPDLYLPDGLTYFDDGSLKSESLRVHCGATSDTAKLISGMSVDFYVEKDTSFRVRYYDDELRLVKYKGTEQEVVVPGYVMAIGQDAFRDNKTIESVVIPEGVTRIIDGGFNGCTALTSVTLPGSLTHIYTMAFYNCSSLSDLYLPDSLTYCDDYSLKSDRLRVHCRADSNTAKLISGMGICFYVGEDTAFGMRYSGENLKLAKYTGNVSKLVIPDYVKSVGQDVFNGNQTITSVEFPEGFTRIEQRSFSNCRSLKTVKLPGTLKEIGEYAFYGAKQLTSIELNEGLRTIGANAFNYTAIEELMLPESLENFDSSLFSGLQDSLKRVALSESMDELPEGLFNGFKVLEEITIPEGIIDIRSGSIRNCPTLKKVNVPTTVLTIEKDNFAGCDYLTLSVYPASAAERFAINNIIPYVYATGNALLATAPEQVASDYQDLVLALRCGDDVSHVTMDGRDQYIFYGVEEGEVYALEIVNRCGDVLGSLESIQVSGIKTEVALPVLVDNIDLKVAVRDADRNNVSSSAQIKWYDGEENEIARGTVLTHVPVGKQISVAAVLNDELSTEYEQPSPITMTVTEDRKAIGIYLTRNQTGNEISMSLNGSYTSANQEQAVLTNWDNVAIVVDDVTTGDERAVATIKDGQLCLGSQIQIGDTIDVMASSKDDDFYPVTKTVTVANGGQIDFAFTQRGILRATFDTGEGNSVSLLVYDAEGQLTWSGTTEENELLTRGLASGAYTVALIERGALRVIPDSLGDWTGLGLSAGTDYLTQTVTIPDSGVTEVDFGIVPTAQSSGDYLEQTTFRVSNSNPTAGKFFSLRAGTQIKEAFAAGASDMTWTVELSRNCVFAKDTLSVEGSLIQNAQIEDSRMAVPVGSAEDTLRVCMLPLEGGSVEITGQFSFMRNGKRVTVPMDPISVKVEELLIEVPKKVNSERSSASGYALPRSQVEVFDNGTSVAQITADETGYWEAGFYLITYGTYSSHTIQAVITTESGYRIRSRTANTVYHYVQDPIRVVGITMNNQNFETALNLYPKGLTGGHTTVPRNLRGISYSFNPAKSVFDFEVRFAGDELDAIKNVNFAVTCEDGNVVVLEGERNSEDTWFARARFTAENRTVSDQINPPWGPYMQRVMEYLEDIPFAGSSLPKRIDVSYFVGEPFIVSTPELEARIEEFEENLSEEDFELEYLPYIVDEDNEYEDINQMIDEINAQIRLYNEARETAIKASNELLDAVYAGDGKIVNPILPEAFIEIRPSASTAERIQDIMLSAMGSTSGDAFQGFQEVYATTGGGSILTRPSAYHEYSTDIYSGDDVVSMPSFSNLEAGIIPIDRTAREKMADAWISYQANMLDLSYDIMGTSNTLISIGENLAGMYDQLKLVMDKKYQAALENIEFFKNDPKYRKEYLKYLDRAEQMEKVAEKTTETRKIAKLAKRLSPAGVLLDVGDISKQAGYGLEIAELLKKYPNDTQLYAAMAEIGLAMTLKGFSLSAYNLSALLASKGIPAWGVYLASLLCIGADMIASNQIDDMMDYLRSAYGSAGSYTVATDTEFKPIIDPSGYVYEAVYSNRVSDAEATVWQKETKYDMYDEPYEEINQWDASEYNQTNPQMTGEDGEFAWNVPDGIWQVRVSKPGYQSAESPWVEVPPEQKDVRIGMVSLDPPQVDRIRQKADGIEIAFSKYLFTNQLDEAFTLTVDGRNIPLTVTYLNAEESPEGVLLVSNVIVTPTEDISGAVEGTLTIGGHVMSYAGISMEGEFTYILKNISATIIAPEDITLLKGQSVVVEIGTKPEDFFTGKLLAIEADGIGVAAQSDNAIDESGRTDVRLQGLDGGVSTITLSIDGYDVRAQIHVTCVDPDDYNALRLPASITAVEEEAFMGSGAEIIVLPEGCESVGNRAFADCVNLKYILIPADNSIAFARDAYDADKVMILQY